MTERATSFGGADSREAMAGTLRYLDIDLAAVADAGSWELIEHAPPDLHDVKETYKRVNDYLMEEAKRGPLPIRHLTGEASALVDPAHRQVLRALRNGEQARLACSFEGEPSAWDFITRQRHNWREVQWWDLIDILSVAAQGLIQIVLLASKAPVHYSIFGQDLVLLQAQHDHPTRKKWVWFIRSRPLADKLEPSLEARFTDAAPIAARSFDVVLDWMHDYETLSVLYRIAYGKEAPGVDEPARADEQTIEKLTAIGFLTEDRQELTELGQQWLTQLSGGE